MDKEYKKTKDGSQLTIGSYLIIKTIAKGGMGEIFLAFDPTCKRHVALKQIREDLAKNEMLKKRFLREAKIASQLSHPSIIPIYDIHLSDPCYYTMPYIEGHTLKDLLKAAYMDEQDGKIPKHSIHSLSRIFLNICEAIAYTHSKNILHRDLKPDNIIIGKFGEVLLLDWGIANYIGEADEPIKNFKQEDFNLTKPGKVTGTLAYMAPERALGNNATRSNDIYSLGAILYQILTLCLPFKRKDLASFRKNMKMERYINPLEKAPHRDIPHKLAEIATKCLLFDEKKRFQSVKKIIRGVKDYIEGRPEWIFTSNLDVNRKSDWIFEENIFLAKHVAISKHTDIAEWVTLMVSNDEFPGNIKLEADLSFSKHSEGLAFLLNILRDQEGFKIEEGYRLWIGSKKSKATKLFRSNVLVLEDETFLSPDIFHHIVIEKVDDELKFFLDGKLIFSHLSHLISKGLHLGLICKDREFEIKNFNIYSSSYNIMVNCLAIPDAFYTKNDFDSAIKEYHRIASSFSGRTEGREASYRCGITYIEKAKRAKLKKEKDLILQEALNEFDKLHSTPSEPLEYLGKSLVYAASNEPEEEAKCLELGLRKFKKSPLLPILQEHIIYRMHESSLTNREAAFRLILLALINIKKIDAIPDTKKLLESLHKHQEKLFFIEETSDFEDQLCIDLGYRLGKLQALVEIFEKKNLDEINKENLLFALLELNNISYVENFFEEQKNRTSTFHETLLLINIALISLSDIQRSLDLLFSKLSKKISQKEMRVIIFILHHCLVKNELNFINEISEKLKNHLINKEDQLRLDSIFIWNSLLENNIEKTKVLFSKYPLEMINEESSPLHLSYGAFLYLTEGKEIADVHFSGVLDSPYPNSYSLASHYISGKKDIIKNCLFWEKKQLYSYLYLYYQAIHELDKAKYYKSLSAKLQD